MYEMIKEKYKNLNISKNDLKPYIFPSQRELNKNKIKTAYLGNYVPWDVRKQVDIIKKELGSKVQSKKGTGKNTVQKNPKWSGELNNKISLEEKTKVIPKLKVDFKENKNFQNGSNRITNKKIKIGVIRSFFKSKAGRI